MIECSSLPHLKSFHHLSGQRWRGMPPRRFLGVVRCTFLITLWRIVLSGEGGGGVDRSSLVCPELGTFGIEGLSGGTSWEGTLPVLTCYQRIPSSSPVVTAGTCGGCGAVGVVLVLAAAIHCRLSMSFWRSSA